jgi:hypothetical protein
LKKIICAGVTLNVEANASQRRDIPTQAKTGLEWATVLI